MKKTENVFRRISLLTGVGIFQFEKGMLTSFQKNSGYHPLVQCSDFREQLMKKAAQQEVPVLYQDLHQVFWGCLEKDGKYILAGPMSVLKLTGIELHRYYRDYGMKNGMEKGIPDFTLSQIVALIQLLADAFLDEEFSQEQLLEKNGIGEEPSSDLEEEQIRFFMDKEGGEHNHHTYIEEHRLLECIRDGNTMEALLHNRELDTAMGRLSKNEVNHWRNLLVVAVTLCTRAAIEGGLPPADAYVLSDFYIQKSETCKDISSLSALKDQVVKELTSKVAERKKSRFASNHVEQCKDYIQKHYREKLYLKDAADALGLSSTYLSRLFAKETGMCFQNYVNWFRVERAVNLLLYSEESIAGIAEYVNFPNQSYFGKIFKQYKNMTPAQYRNRYKRVEYQSGEKLEAKKD